MADIPAEITESDALVEWAEENYPNCRIDKRLSFEKQVRHVKNHIASVQRVETKQKNEELRDPAKWPFKEGFAFHAAGPSKRPQSCYIKNSATGRNFFVNEEEVLEYLEEGFVPPK